MSQGRIGVLVDSTNAYAAGRREVAKITFTIPDTILCGGINNIQCTYPIVFGNVPTPLSISSVNGVLLPAINIDGFVRFVTAAGVDVSGRVLTPDGRGLRNAVVILTDSSGNRKTATTSSFGYYRFEDVESGSTVVLGVQSKRYRFVSRILQIVDTIVDADFIALE